MNLRSKIEFARKSLTNIYSNITLEPVMLLFAMSLGFFYIAGTQLYVDKMCRVNLVREGLVDFNNSKEICDNIYHNKTLQIENQERVTRLQTMSKAIQAIPPLIYALLAGPWCDKHGRKPLILISLWGYILCNVVFLINTIWYNELRAEYLLLECIQGMVKYLL